MTLEIPAPDLEIEIWPQRPPGGQHVGAGPRGVKITHIPSGLIAISDAGRSQHVNRQIAMDMLLGGLTSPKFQGGR